MKLKAPNLVFVQTLTHHDRSMRNGKFNAWNPTNTVSLAPPPTSAVYKQLEHLCNSPAVMNRQPETISIACGGNTLDDRSENHGICDNGLPGIVGVQARNHAHHFA